MDIPSDGPLRRLARRVRRAAQAFAAPDEPARTPVAPTPRYLALASAQPAWARAFRKGAWVFVLQFAPRGGGGLADVLHLGIELERRYGLQVHYMVTGGQDDAYAWECMHWTQPALRREQLLRSLDFAPEFLCATAWPTAYEVRAMPSARKLYFVQDFEPWFHKAGVARWYAETSYRLGLEMFTLGPWLAHRLRDVAPALAMPFPVSDAADPGLPLRQRNTIAIYLQPDKEHRGTALLVEGARRLQAAVARSRPEMAFVLFGSEHNNYLLLDFPSTLHGVLTEDEMLALLRQARLGICASFTNTSLLTLRFPCHGCPVIDLDLPGVRDNVADAAAPLMGLFTPEPDALVRAAVQMLDREVDEDTRTAVARRLEEEHGWSACARALAPLFAGRPSD